MSRMEFLSRSVAEVSLLKSFIFFFALHCSAQKSSHRDIKSLESDSGFNKVRLHWQYPELDDDSFEGFKITYCEDQAWGPHRCRNAVLGKDRLSHRPGKDKMVEYSGEVGHLRMSTNYTIKVTPVVVNPELSGRSPGAKSRAIPDVAHSAQVFVQTKGFSARAVSCLTNSTLVEVETGPYFGGKISVEGSEDPDCATQGNEKNPRSMYRLNINHSLCGSKMINDSVRTYVLVQENLPILTHSTRRFMVVCHYIPEAFTVSAGVSLPGENKPGIVPVDQSVNEVDPSELFDSTNTLFNSRRFRSGKALKFEQEEPEQETDGMQMWSQLVLMVVLVVGGVTGLSCAFWHFGRHAGLAAAIRAGITSRRLNESDEARSADVVVISNILDTDSIYSESQDPVADDSCSQITEDPSVPPLPERIDSVPCEVAPSCTEDVECAKEEEKSSAEWEKFEDSNVVDCGDLDVVTV